MDDANYRRLDDGIETDANDPERGVWYSAAMTCGYWTDDWSNLSTHRGIPCCPHCGCVGMQAMAKEWFNVSEEFLKSHPRYDEWLPTSKGHCGRTDNVGFLQSYQLWLEESR